MLGKHMWWIPWLLYQWNLAEKHFRAIETYSADKNDVSVRENISISPCRFPSKT